MAREEGVGAFHTTPRWLGTATRVAARDVRQAHQHGEMEPRVEHHPAQRLEHAPDHLVRDATNRCDEPTRRRRNGRKRRRAHGSQRSLIIQTNCDAMIRWEEKESERQRAVHGERHENKRSFPRKPRQGTNYRETPPTLPSKVSENRGSEEEPRSGAAEGDPRRGRGPARGRPLRRARPSCARS